MEMRFGHVCLCGDESNSVGLRLRRIVFRELSGRSSPPAAARDNEAAASSPYIPTAFAVLYGTV